MTSSWDFKIIQRLFYCVWWVEQVQVSTRFHVTYKFQVETFDSLSRTIAHETYFYLITALYYALLKSKKNKRMFKTLNCEHGEKRSENQRSNANCKNDEYCSWLIMGKWMVLLFGLRCSCVFADMSERWRVACVSDQHHQLRPV